MIFYWLEKTPPHLTDMFDTSPFFPKKTSKNEMASTSVTWKTEFNKFPPRPLQLKLVLVLLEITAPHLLHPRRLLRFSNTAMTRMAKDLSKAAGGEGFWKIVKQPRLHRYTPLLAGFCSLWNGRSVMLSELMLEQLPWNNITRHLGYIFVARSRYTWGFLQDILLN